MILLHAALTQDVTVRPFDPAFRLPFLALSISLIHPRYQKFAFLRKIHASNHAINSAVCAIHLFVKRVSCKLIILNI